MRDKNKALLAALPAWIDWGLRYFVDNARSKNGVIDYKADTWDNVEMKTLGRSGDITPPKIFFTTTSDALWAQKGAGTQAQFFTNFLVNGAGSRNPKYKNILSDYIKNLIFVLDSEKAPDPTAQKEPQNEKAEEEMRRVAQQAYRTP